MHETQHEKHLNMFEPSFSSTSKLRILNVTNLDFAGSGCHLVGQVLCEDASRLFLDHFSEHLR